MNTEKHWIIHKKTALLAGVIIALLILYFYVNVKAGDAYQNCTQILQATGRSHILKGDKLYNPAMDRDKGGADGIACE